MQPSIRSRTRRQGSIRIEVGIVLLVLGTLAAGAGSGVMTAKADAALRTARDDVDNLAQIAEAYQLLGDANTCPSVAQLEASKLLGRRAHAQDPWGTRYEVTCEQRVINVRSPGPDRERGTADDIARF
jgi:type II secretory pathway pseudopilin PulG